MPIKTCASDGNGLLVAECKLQEPRMVAGTSFGANLQVGGSLRDSLRAF